MNVWHKSSSKNSKVIHNGLKVRHHSNVLITRFHRLHFSPRQMGHLQQYQQDHTEYTMHTNKHTARMWLSLLITVVYMTLTGTRRTRCILSLNLYNAYIYIWINMYTVHVHINRYTCITNLLSCTKYISNRFDHWPWNLWGWRPLVSITLLCTFRHICHRRTGQSHHIFPVKQILKLLNSFYPFWYLQIHCCINIALSLF